MRHFYPAEIFIVRTTTRINEIVSRIGEAASSRNLWASWARVAIARRALVSRAGPVINSSASVWVCVVRLACVALPLLASRLVHASAGDLWWHWDVCVLTRGPPAGRGWPCPNLVYVFPQLPTLSAQHPPRSSPSPLRWMPSLFPSHSHEFLRL